MQNAIMAIGIASASVAGSALGYWGFLKNERRKIHRACRLQAGAQTEQESATRLLLITGIYRRVLELALSLSRPNASTATSKPGKFWLLQEKRLETSLLKAGLTGVVIIEGCGRVRKLLSIGLAVCGALCGALFSELLAFILAGIGFLTGYHALQAALYSEIEARTTSVELELSQLIEVLVLGLRSGLSFDRSLEFYCQYFTGGLADLCARMQTQWNHGLITREEGFRQIAASYDSKLLERIMESIIRALRFGTSLAETLSNAGAEIRATRKTKLEEKVAKAPVKMLIPIGTLILPAMLILILGPILLDLMAGF